MFTGRASWPLSPSWLIGSTHSQKCIQWHSTPLGIAFNAFQIAFILCSKFPTDFPLYSVPSLFLYIYSRALGGEFFMSAKISYQEMRPQKPSSLFKVLHSNANEPSKYFQVAGGVHCSQRLLRFSSILPTSALYISNPCPVSLRSLVSRVPELRAARPPES